jgi:diguanylate cyclase (GGDEF)-like protein
VVLPLGGVSRVHCAIRRDAAGLWLRDLGSTNGTRRNGESVPAHQDVRLQIGDLIAIGGAIFKLLDGESPESEYHDRVFRTMALDGLTQVRNRRSLQDALESEIARSRRHQHALSLLLLDVDRFKEVNDRHGHLCGDLVLRRIAALLSRHGRRENCTARYGGDEFAIVLAPGMTGDQVAQAAETYRSALIEPIAVGDLRVTVGGSVGIATTVDQGMDVLGLLALADLDMYRIKRGAADDRAKPGGPDARGRSAGRPPTWTVSVQGASSAPLAGWPGVRWSASSGGGTTPGNRVRATV